MMLFVAVNVVMIPLVLHAHVATHSLFRDLAVPGIRAARPRRACCSSSRSSARPSRRGSCTSSRATSSNKKISPRWLNYERIDTILGSFVVVITAALLMGITAAGLSHHGGTNSYVNALSVAHDLTKFVGHSTGDLFAIILLNASIIGAAAAHWRVVTPSAISLIASIRG